MIERIIQLHFLLRSIADHFNHNELVHLWNRGRHLIIHVFYRQLEFEFAIQLHDIAFHITEHKYQSIESGYHWNADGLHQSTVDGGEIVHDHRGEQIVVLIGNLKIGGSHQR